MNHSDRTLSPTFDRAKELRLAEKLLRVGKMQAAIEAYEAIARECPDDLDTALALAGLYLRTGAIANAVDRFIEVADGLYREGQLPKAGAVYEQALTASEYHEHALLQLAAISAAEGRLEAARSHLMVVAGYRLSQGEREGAAEVYIHIASLDPHDVDARLLGARARQEVGDFGGAIADLLAVATILTERDRHVDAASVLREAAVLAPEDIAIRRQLFNADILAGNIAEARELASTPSQWRKLAAIVSAADPDDGLELMREATRRHPSDLSLLAGLARVFVAQGNAVEAVDYLRPEMTDGDPVLMLAVAEIMLRGGRQEEAVSLARQCMDADSRHIADVASIATSAAAVAADTAWILMQSAVDAWERRQDWPMAAAALDQFIATAPASIPAVVRLVEVAIDGQLPTIASRAQAQLADTYIAAGAGADALTIVDDLLFREPQNRAHLDRFRQALILTGAADPDAVIASRLEDARKSNLLRDTSPG